MNLQPPRYTNRCYQGWSVRDSDQESITQYINNVQAVRLCTAIRFRIIRTLNQKRAELHRPVTSNKFCVHCHVRYGDGVNLEKSLLIAALRNESSRSFGSVLPDSDGFSVSKEKYPQRKLMTDAALVAQALDSMYHNGICD